MDDGLVTALWRYPVAGMAGERLRSTQVDSRGVAGDRQHVVRGPEGRLSALDVPALAAWTATFPFNPDGAIVTEAAPPFPVIADPSGLKSWRWGDPRLGFALERELGRAVELVRELDIARSVVVAATEPDVPAAVAGINIVVSLPLAGGGWSGRVLEFRDGVRLRLVSSRRDGPGIEARVIAAGRLVVGEPVALG
jgi:hypothetical protein